MATQQADANKGRPDPKAGNANKAESATKPGPGHVPAGGAPVTETRPTPGEGKEAKEGKESEDKDGKGERQYQGAVPKMPICVIWREANGPDGRHGAVVASLIHPRGGELTVKGKGMNGTLGTLADEGYPIGPVRAEGPDWAQNRIPAGVTVLGYANVQGFPLPNTPPVA